MILAGHQPQYLPYIGFFNKAMLCDKFVLVDHVQFERKGWQNRNRIREKRGWCWLIVPVFTKGKFTQKMTDVRIDDHDDWREKHWKTIYFNYKNAPHFREHEDFFRGVYARKWDELVSLDEAIMSYLFKELGIEVEVVKSSSFNFTGRKTDLLIEMCERLGADTYLSGSGPGAKRYVDESRFKKEGLKHRFQEFRHPVYSQQYPGFVPYMSVIDLLFNCGSEKSREIIRDSGGVKGEGG